jgi:hypothetical protein
MRGETYQRSLRDQAAHQRCADDAILLQKDLDAVGGAVGAEGVRPLPLRGPPMDLRARAVRVPPVGRFALSRLLLTLLILGTGGHDDGRQMCMAGSMTSEATRRDQGRKEETEKKKGMN